MAAFRNTMVITINGMKRYRIAEGAEVNEATNVYIQSQSDAGAVDEIGLLPSKIPGPYALLDTCRGYQFPGEFSCEVEIRPAAGGKTGLFIVSVNPVNPVKPVSAKV